jgi:hypothetical protein
MWDENLALGTWVHAMRQYKRKGKLSEERTQKLEELDFTWRIHSGASETGEDEELEVDDDDDEEEQHQPAAAAKVTPTRPKGRRKSAETEINDEIWEERYNDLVEYWKRHAPEHATHTTHTHDTRHTRHTHTVHTPAHGAIC